ncbi:hypothetical protein GCM10025786_13430 [Nocardioides caeni]
MPSNAKPRPLTAAGEYSSTQLTALSSPTAPDGDSGIDGDAGDPASGASSELSDEQAASIRTPSTAAPTRDILMTR